MGQVPVVESNRRFPSGDAATDGFAGGGISGPSWRLCGISLSGWALALVAFAFAMPVVTTMLGGPTYFDDAYMFHRYALNLREGLGVAWNPDGVQTYGLTSHLWLAAVLVASFLPFAPGVTLQIASVVAGAAAMAVMAIAISRHAKTKWLANPAVGLAVVSLPLLLNTKFAYHLTSGMDTALSLAMHGLIVLSVLRYMADPRFAAACVVGITAFAAVLTRPENGLCALGVPALAFLAMWRWDRWRDLAGLIVLPVVLIGAELVVCWLVFGTPLPLSFYAKSLHAYSGFQNPENAVTYMMRAISFGLLFVPFLIASTRRKDLPWVLAFLLPVLATFVYLVTMRQVMGWIGRYYVPFLPYLIVPAVLMLDRAMADTKLRRELPRRLAYAVGTVIAVVCAWQQLRSTVEVAYVRVVIPPPIAEPTLTIAAKSLLPQVEWHDTNVALADHVAARLPAGATMAASEVGYLGSVNRRVAIIDLVGLNDTTIGRRGFSMDYLLSRRPDLIWLPHQDYTGLRAMILSDSRLYEQYEVIAGAFTYGLAIRRDSVHRGVVDAGVRSAWAAVYPGFDIADYVVLKPAAR